MILMNLYTLPNATSGIDEILTQTVTTVPSFAPLLFAFVWFVVMLGGAGMQSRRLGTADYPMWAMVASLSVFLLALLMSVIEGLIRLEWLVIVIVITIFSGIWLFLDRKAGEI
jgi:hypothetical protein